MCTIIFANRVFGDSIIVAENRDEFYGRDWIPPKRTELENGRWILAPRDERAGGTWMGVNSDGMVATVANIYSDSIEYNEEARSRGTLCTELLELSTSKEARDHIENSVAENEYNGFNLLVASPDGSFCAVYDGSLSFLVFDEGVHVITNSRADEPDDKARNVLDSVPSTQLGRDEWLDEVKQLLTNHELGVCSHFDDRGTTSSSIISVDARDRSNPEYIFSQGPPCETDYESFS